VLRTHEARTPDFGFSFLSFECMLHGAEPNVAALRVYTFVRFESGLVNSPNIFVLLLLANVAYR
jgi:hypothetical protein